jgi:ABC-type Zn2+ transport system substrate-binding protein/surface adhesin
MEHSYNILLCIQNTFSRDVANEIYGDLAEHIYEKWIRLDDNILNFMSCLDYSNRDILFEWGKKYYNNI